MSICYPYVVPRATGDLSLDRIAWEGGAEYWAQFPKADDAGWSNPSFFPIAVFLGKPDAGHPAALASIGINTYAAAEYNPPVSDITDHLFAIIQSPISHSDEAPNAWSQADVGTDPNVVGWWIYDECEMGEGRCSTWSDDATRLANHMSWTADTRDFDDGRFMFANFGNGVLNTFWAVGTMPDWVGHVDGAGVDKYGYTSPQVRFEFGRTPSYDAEGGTEANSQSSAVYGWLARQMKIFDDHQHPYWCVVETKMPFLGEVGRTIITYAQIEGAVWSAIANEARGIIYFQHNGFYDQPSPPTTDPNTGIAPTNEVYSLVDGQAALLTAVSTLNSRVTALAPVINTQSYEWDFGPSDIDTMLKTHGGFAYIFASVGVAGSTGSKTFTLTGTGISGTTVDVVYESRTISVSAGQFSDTFANEYSHHIYKIAI